MDAILALCAAIPSLLLLRLIGAAIYNIYFHPLSNYPGPKFAAASRIPTVWYMIQGKNVQWVVSLHKKYGDVVRTGPDELSYTNAQGWRDIYGHRVRGKASFLKNPTFFPKPPNGVDSLVASSDEAHARARRIFSHAFSDKALREQEPLFQKYVDLLLQKLTDAVQDPQQKCVVNMVNMYNFTTFDIMGDLTFGDSLQLLDHSDYSPWVATIFQNIKAVTMMRATSYFPAVENLLKLLIPKSLAEKRISHFKYSTDRVDKRLSANSEHQRPDIWGMILRQDEAKGLSLDEMHSNAAAFMIAGTETTATLLSGLTFLLLANPESLAKLVHEIRGAFLTNDDITIEHLMGLKYLNACLEEGLRMYPPVPIGTTRIVPPEGAAICGKYVPGGITVSVSHYSTYYSAENFALPNSFIPERWLGDPRFEADNKLAFQPFSYGPRNCLGKNMAYHEMRLILSKVLWNFDLSLTEESKNWSDQDVFTLWDKPPLMVKITPVSKV
ncbi:benzoate 4-monooxygenase cytochrome P450 [Lepidopterella palustris CBS 459.81]|uniref:Benzoate 4-monooxygenase cytochrome P450 n=1 Tax=Lepidopterella palustris CBS 459.81 TaxID=1314670 RepID=A0A8E2JBK0_9PEZI|nr:benzoate 4-monooxygenase cytochrome P450 [Lepidopterella palustris CBS 459.81]